MPEEKTTKVQFAKYVVPVVESLKKLGGSAKPKQVYDQIESDYKIPDEVKSIVLKSGETQFHNQVRWAREYLRRGGFIDGSVRGVWTLTESGKTTTFSDSLITSLVSDHSSNVKNSYEDIIDDLLAFYKVSFQKHWEDEKI